jgi:DNA invertase Pin-like site-specific DNA recombinase
MELGYARVSTSTQDLTRQIDALEAVGIPAERIYVDKKTGATTDRAGFQSLLEYARAGDVIVVHELSRLARKVRDVLNVMHDLTERGIGVRTLADRIKIDTTDPSDPTGQIAVVLLALFGEWERTYAIERAAHARAVAQSQGRQVGRPPTVDAEKIRYATYLRDTEGRSMEYIAQHTGIPRSTLYRYMPKRRSTDGPTLADVRAAQLET